MDFLQVDALIALLTLTALEVVLGIDNVIFIAILVGKLPREQQTLARRVGLSLAMITRILLLLMITWIMGLKATLFEFMHHPFSGKDLILIGGGLFLIAKATFEVHDKLEGGGEEHGKSVAKAAFGVIIAQIIMLDIVFSLDSVITAVGMVPPDQLWVMITAVIVAVGVMLVFAGRISDFIHRHPTMKMLALAFLLLIGVTLVAEGLGRHIEKGYIYFAMAFSLFVEVLNMRLRKKARPVELHHTTVRE